MNFLLKPVDEDATPCEMSPVGPLQKTYVKPTQGFLSL